MKGLKLNNSRTVGTQGHPIEGFLVITSVNLVLAGLFELESYTMGTEAARGEQHRGKKGV